jgi:hypothetical protein
LTQGLKLEEMEMSDMLDVLHYYMEEDYNFSSSEQVDAKSKIRKTIYKNFYNTEYKFGDSSRTSYSNVSADGVDIGDPLVAFDPSEPEDPLKGPTKAYVAPIEPNVNLVKPFGDLLDSPLEK